MAEPLRWRAEGSGAPEGVRELLEAAAPPSSIPEATHRLALARATELAATPSAPVLALVGGKALMTTAVGGAACISMAVGLARQPAPVSVTYLGLDQATASKTAGREASSPAPGKPPVAAETLALEPAAPQATAAATPVRRASPTRLPEPAEASGALAAETRLVERVRAALDSDPELALRVSQEFARRFPGGQLSAANQYLAAQALQRLGRYGEAEQRASELVTADPDGLYAERVRRLVGREQ